MNIEKKRAAFQGQKLSRPCDDDAYTRKRQTESIF